MASLSKLASPRSRSPDWKFGPRPAKAQWLFGPTTTYWLAAASGSWVVARAWLNSSMFGPMETSYQLLNHSDGTPQPMSSW
ncbi:hypothetical protein D3C85_1414630 [compost metagenome]